MESLATKIASKILGEKFAEESLEINQTYFCSQIRDFSKVLCKLLIIRLIN